uniref:Ubiquitin-like domain-containing protein n=1 Tax=Anas zonorhyncha TaxID=75864 RepID=A0A8B9UER8_9AVES
GEVRLSTGKDLRLSASMGDTIGQLKKQLQAQEGIELAWQRWFFSGKLLTDPRGTLASSYKKGKQNPGGLSNVPGSGNSCGLCLPAPQPHVRGADQVVLGMLRP